jgi:thioredoxin reductase (NADPH)
MSKKPNNQITDVTIVGAGPTGLFGAFYAGLRELSVKVIDALPQPGGQLITLYPEKMIYDTPGFPEVQAKKLVTNLYDQAKAWNPIWALGERALKLERVDLPGEEDDDQGWLIETDKAKHYTRTVIIAAGIGAFQPKKLPNSESIDPFEEKGVEYMVSDLSSYEGKKVLIVGGGDSAVDWALSLEPIADQVTLIHRREGFRAHDSSVNALMASKVDVRVFYELRELQGNGRVEKAVIFDNRTDEDMTLDVDGVILSLGFKADLGPIREWGLETIGRRYIRVDEKMQTNLPGVFAAGDVALQEQLDPLNLIVVGYGQVTVAVNYAYTMIKPGGKVFPGHSSEMTGK